jgi:threonine dehydrogenase-like Zn-dependent dehydrogenase
MKAAIVSAPGILEIREIPDPQPGPYDCLVKIDACAVCTGTDSTIISGEFPWISPYPTVLGHESTGLIVDVGPKVKHFKVGQRVTRPAGVLAGETVGGISSTWGGYVEWGLVRDARAAEAAGIAGSSAYASSRNPLPEDVDPISASLSINQREILWVSGRMKLRKNSAVVVIGSGYNGLLFSLFSKHFGAGRVVLVGSPRLAELGQARFGADAYISYQEAEAIAQVRQALGTTPTHIVDAVGWQSSVELAQKLLGWRTAFGCYGIHAFNATTALREQIATKHPALDMGADEAACVDEWYALWKAGFFHQPGMYDEVVTLDQLPQAFERLARREAVKIVVQM